MQSSLKADFEQANALLHGGRLGEAEQGYRTILVREPTHLLATYNLGVITAQTRRFEESERLFARVLSLQPGLHQALLVRAKVLCELGRAPEAIGCYDQFLAAQPGNFSALNDRASALIGLGRYDEALADLTKALSITPNDPLALYNKASALLHRGEPADAVAALDAAVAAKADFVDAFIAKANILSKLGQTEAAIAVYSHAIAINPARPDALNNLGGVLMDLKRWPDALAQFERALAVAPNHIEARVNYGRTLGKLGRTDEELAAYDHVLAFAPGFAGAHLCRGVALTDRRRVPEAIAALETAVRLSPHDASAWHALGNALVAANRRAEAVTAFDRAIAIDPKHASAFNNKALALRLICRHEEAAESFAKVAAIRPDYPYVLGNLFGARLLCCDWRDYDAMSARLTEAARAAKPVETPFGMLVYSESEGDQLACAKLYARDYAGAAVPWTLAPYDNPKIRVAYLSADLQNHATAHLLAGVLEAHSRERFEFTAVSFGRDDGTPMRARLRASFDRFIDAAQMEDSEVVRLMRELKIDIAVDLKGFTNEARPRIFTARAAPVQVNFLGYPCTWGSECMDYLIADEQLVPAGHDVFYSEKVVRMPESYQPNDRKRVIADTKPSRAELGLPEKGFVFCCFNGNYKITPTVFDVWMRLLHRVEGSVLWLLASNDASVRNLTREALARGLDPARIIFSPGIDTPLHLARQRAADLFLDTLPINAHTTTSDALWAGLPVLTCHGPTFAARVAASLLAAAGLPELITHSLAEYEETAFRLATAPGLLAGIRAKLARNRDSCALFDTDRFRRHLESAYVTMWERYRRGDAPAAFAVPALPASSA